MPGQAVFRPRLKPRITRKQTSPNEQMDCQPQLYTLDSICYCQFETVNQQLVVNNARNEQCKVHLLLPRVLRVSPYSKAIIRHRLKNI